MCAIIIAHFRNHISNFIALYTSECSILGIYTAMQKENYFLLHNLSITSIIISVITQVTSRKVTGMTFTVINSRVAHGLNQSQQSVNIKLFLTSLKCT